ncbi:RNA polymerase II transcription factor SIII [Macleaya cordata]|uniref:RNA polymerase II transcription factor SIII n=1 Tax=Macleaya cordata TaxID=56857 RepID=A0A200QEW4_MACCD|nr:RNA polymerase II transcription factor SIII [Macleaya cordata]
MFRRKIPTLVELCIQTAIDNVRYLGDVGETDIHLLKEVLPHCTVDQLMHIEKSSKGRDLSPVTDKLWKKFYEKQFGSKSADSVIEQMKAKKVSFKWRKLYEAKLKDWDEIQKQSADRLKQLYRKEDVKKQSRQIQLCTKIPPSSKRSFWGGTGSCSNSKGNLMKKARMEYLNSHEVKMKKTTALQRNQVISRPSTTKPGGFHGNDSSSSRFTKPLGRRS